MKNLTNEEKNLIKDILRAIGKDETLNFDFASVVGLSEPEFDKLCDSIYIKLGNGRLIVEGN